MLIESISQNLKRLAGLLQKLTDAEYTEPCAELGNATIGGHSRHIVEMFNCLLQSYDAGTINYDARKRDFSIENFSGVAASELISISSRLNRENKTLVLHYGGQPAAIQTNYFRELLYNFEHCIHHEALIKVALLKKTVEIPEGFGIAPSTLEYRSRCAQ